MPPLLLQRYQFQAAGGWVKLRDTVRKQFGSEAHPFTRLVPDLSGLPCGAEGRRCGARAQQHPTRQQADGLLKRNLRCPPPPLPPLPCWAGGVDPDDAFSSIPCESAGAAHAVAAVSPAVSHRLATCGHLASCLSRPPPAFLPADEKGFAFIHYMHELVGGAPAFEPFFKAYIQRFQAQPLTSEDFRTFFCDYFKVRSGSIGPPHVFFYRWFKTWDPETGGEKGRGEGKAFQHAPPSRSGSVVGECVPPLLICSPPLHAGERAHPGNRLGDLAVQARWAVLRRGGCSHSNRWDGLRTRLPLAAAAGSTRPASCPTPLLLHLRLVFTTLRRHASREE